MNVLMMIGVLGGGFIYIIFYGFDFLFASSHFIATAVFTVDIGCSSMQWSWHLRWTQNTKVFFYEDISLARTLENTNLQVRSLVTVVLACNFACK